MDGLIERERGAPGRRVTLLVERVGERTYRLAGELDVSTVPRLELGLAREVASPGPLTLDLSEMSFLDSRGLSALIRLARRVRAEVLLRAPQAAVRRALWLTGIGSESRFGLRIEDAPQSEPEPGPADLVSGSDFLRPE